MIVYENWLDIWGASADIEDLEVLVASDQEADYILFSRYNYGDYSIRVVREDRLSKDRVPVSNLIMVQNIGDNVFELVKARGELLVTHWLEDNV